MFLRFSQARFAMVSQRVLQVFGLSQSETYVNFLLNKVAITLANTNLDDEAMVKNIRTQVRPELTGVNDWSEFSFER